MRTYSSAEMVMSSTNLLRKGVRKFCNQTIKSNIVEVSFEVFIFWF